MTSCITAMVSEWVDGEEVDGAFTGIHLWGGIVKVLNRIRCIVAGSMMDFMVLVLRRIIEGPQ